MAAPIVYRSDDSGALVLDGQQGSLVALLDNYLPLMGWTIEFSGTGKSVYRNNTTSGTGLYWRVQDDGAVALPGRVAAIQGYETASDVDTGAGPFPTAVQAANGMGIYKSSSADAVARPWLLIGDSRTVYLVTWYNSADFTGITALLHAWGDVKAVKAGGDPWAAFVMAGYRADQLSNSYWHGGRVGTSLQGHFLARPLAATVGAEPMDLLTASLLSVTTGVMGAGSVPYPDPATGGLLYGRPVVTDDDGISYRGHLRGLFQPFHNQPLTSMTTHTEGALSLLPVNVYSAGGGQVLFDLGDWV